MFLVSNSMSSNNIVLLVVLLVLSSLLLRVIAHTTRLVCRRGIKRREGCATSEQYRGPQDKQHENRLPHAYYLAVAGLASYKYAVGLAMLHHFSPTPGCA